MATVLDWFGRVAAHLGDVNPWWLALAAVLKTGESASIGLTYRNILRAAYPRANVSFKTAWGGSAGGTAVNSLVPAQGGTAAMIAIYRRAVRGSSVSGLTTVFFVESAFFLVISFLLLFSLGFARPRAVKRGSPFDELAAFIGHHLVIVPIVIVVLAVVVRFVWPRVKPRLDAERRKAKKGAAIFADPRRYGREVALPSLASYVCRMGTNAVFMAAFGIPVTLFTVVAVVSSHVLSGLFRITPGGLGQTQAVDVLALRGYASSSTVTAFSLAEASFVTVVNVVIGVVVTGWAFGFHQVRDLVRSSRSARVAKRGRHAGNRAQ